MCRSVCVLASEGTGYISIRRCALGERSKRVVGVDCLNWVLGIELRPLYTVSKEG